MELKKLFVAFACTFLLANAVAQVAEPIRAWAATAGDEIDQLDADAGVWVCKVEKIFKKNIARLIFLVALGIGAVIAIFGERKGVGVGVGGGAIFFLLVPKLAQWMSSSTTQCT